ncbi:MAG: hypothetical protein HQ581_14560 [Planctomycetes bacterium]|nr:hypothetical protein [Planctomycetota bacterium]
MSCRRLVKGVACAGVLIVLTAPGCQCGHENAADDKLPEMVDAKDLAETDVLPHAQGPVTPGRNYLYCATFQLAWNEFADEILGEPIKLEGSPPMAEMLNAREVGREILSEDSYVAMAGKASDGIIEKIRAEVQRKFSGTESRMLDDVEDELEGDDTALIAYAYLQKSLPFAEKFDDLQAIDFRARSGEVGVAAFGLKDFKWKSPRYAALGKQVTILDYVDDDDFILRLNTASGNEKLVLAKIPPAESLAATIAAVKRRIENPAGGDSFSSRLRKGETLAVPVVSVGVRRNFTELLGRYFQNPGWEEYFVFYAQQGIRFRLDATGARVESEAAFVAATAKEPERKAEPRQLVFDKPFLILLEEADSDQPYFALWVETAEVLEKSR